VFCGPETAVVARDESEAVAEIHFFRWGGGAKFPTKLSNFRHPPPPPFALEKIVFSPLLGQNFRKFVNFP
jgi:hypothetical protein